MYRTTGRAHLSRARIRLSEGTQEALFYAALELRLGIESRIHEYLEARADVASRKKHGYQIAKLARGLEQVFAAGEKVVQVRGLDSEGEELWVVHFTPVRARLRKHGERLGDLLHQQPFRADGDEWWTSQRLYLEEVAAELEFATTGILMGPPLLEKATGKMSFVLSKEPEDLTDLHVSKVGESLTLHVTYHEELPSRPGA